MNRIHRLLVISCSARKRKDAELLAAIDRYDGPAFRVLRHYLAQAADPLRVLILSAKYGLIEASREIPDYDLRLTAKAAQAMRDDVLRVLKEVLSQTPCAEVGFCLGKDYRKAIAGYQDVIPSNTTVTFISGTQGLRLRNLRAWLVTNSPDEPKGGHHE
jgi:hypothetical protein